LHAGKLKYLLGRVKRGDKMVLGCREVEGTKKYYGNIFYKDLLLCIIWILARRMGANVCVSWWRIRSRMLKLWGLLAMQENTQGFDRGISIWGRHIHYCSSMDGVSFWNGNPSPSCHFFLMHILHLSCFRNEVH
jgi:hypothetical protein